MSRWASLRNMARRRRSPRYFGQREKWVLQPSAMSKMLNVLFLLVTLWLDCCSDSKNHYYQEILLWQLKRQLCTSKFLAVSRLASLRNMARRRRSPRYFGQREKWVLQPSAMSKMLNIWNHFCSFLCFCAWLVVHVKKTLLPSN